MKLRKAEILTLLVVLVAIGMSLYAQPVLPDLLATHWQLDGTPDNYSPRDAGLTFIPSALIIIFMLFFLTPRIDPLKENIFKFIRYFDGFMVLLALFLLYLHVLLIAWNIGAYFDMRQALLPGLSLIVFYSGVLMLHTRRNWFIGIRTPWTLSSDKVWKKTHDRGAVLFKALAFVILGSALLPPYAFRYALIAILFVVLYIISYSYFEYQKEQRVAGTTSPPPAP